MGSVWRGEAHLTVYSDSPAPGPGLPCPEVLPGLPRLPGGALGPNPWPRGAGCLCSCWQSLPHPGRTERPADSLSGSPGGHGGPARLQPLQTTQMHGRVSDGRTALPVEGFSEMCACSSVDVSVAVFPRVQLHGCREGLPSRAPALPRRDPAGLLWHTVWCPLCGPPAARGEVAPPAAQKTRGLWANLPLTCPCPHPPSGNVGR